MLDAELAGARLAVSGQHKNAEAAQTDRQALALKVAELAHCEVDLSVAQSEMTQLRAEAETLRSEIGLKSKVDRLLVHKEDEVTKLQSELTELKLEVSSIRGELAEAEGMNRQFAVKEAGKVSLQVELNRLGSELKSMRSNSQDMLSKHSQQAAELTQVRAELSQSQSEASQLRLQLTQAEAEASRKNNELSQLQPELESLRKLSQRVSAEAGSGALLTQKEAEMSQLQIEVSQLQAELDNAKQQLHQQLPAVSEQSHGSESAQHGQTQLPHAESPESAQPELQQDASWHGEADQEASRAASPAPLAESASVSSAVASCKHSEAMSEGELKKMAEAFRKSLGIEVRSHSCWGGNLDQLLTIPVDLMFSCTLAEALCSQAHILVRHSNLVEKDWTLRTPYRSAV